MVLAHVKSSNHRCIPVPLCFVVLVLFLAIASLLFCSCLDPHRLPLQSQVHPRHLSARLRFLQSHTVTLLHLDNWTRYLNELVATVVDVGRG